MEEGQERYVIRIEQQGGEQVVKVYDTIEKRALQSGDKIDASARKVAQTEIKAAKDVIKANEEKMAAIRKQYDTLEKTIAAKQKSINAHSGVGATRADLDIAARAAKEIEEIRKKQAELDREAEKYDAELRQAEGTIKSLETVLTSTGEKQKSMRSELQKAKEEAAKLLMAWRQMSDEEKATAKGQAMKQHLDELLEQTGELKDAMDDVNRATKGSASDTRTFDALSEGLDSVISLYGVAQGAAVAFGVSEEELMAMQTKFQAVLAASNALKTIQNNLQKESNLMMGVASVQAWAQAKAEAAAASATVGHTVAQKAFNLVANMNPYVLLATAAVSLVGILALVTKGTKENTKAQKAAAEAAKKLAEEQKHVAEAISSGVADSVSKYKALRSQWEKLKDVGSKTKWIKDNKSAFDQLNIAVKNINDADKVFVERSDEVIKALIARAKATATAKLYEEEYAKKVKNDVKQTIDNGRQQRVYSMKDRLSKGEKAYLESQGFNMSGATNATSQAQVDALNRWSGQRAKKIRDKENANLARYEKAMEDAEKAAFGAESALGSLSTGPGGSGSNDTDKTPKGPKDRSAYDIAEMKRQMEQTKDELAKSSRQLALDVRQAEIDGMEEGFEKERAQIDLDYEKTIEQIAEKRASMLKALQDAEKKQWDIDNPNAEKDGKVFTPSVFSLSSQDESRLGELEKQAGEAHAKAMEEVNKKEQASWNEYLKQYGDYQQRRMAIQKEYEQKIAEAGGDKGAVAILAEQEKADLEELDKLFGKVASDFADLFADASLKSVKSVQKLIDKYKLLIDYMQGGGMTGEGGGKVSREQVLAAGFTDADLQKIQGDPEKLKAVTDQIKSLQATLSEKAPFKAFEDNVKKAYEQFKQDGDFGNLAVNITGELQGIVAELRGIGEDLGTIFDFDTSKGSAFDKAFSGTEGVLGIGMGVGKMMNGDFLGGLKDGIGGIAKLVETFGGSNIEKVTKHIDSLNRSNDNLRDAMNELKEAFDDAKVSELPGIVDKMAKNLEQQTQNMRKVLTDQAKMWERGSHSVGGQINAGKAGNWSKWASEASAQTGKDIGKFGDLWNILTPEELEKLATERVDLWNQLEDMIAKATNEHTSQEVMASLDAYKDMAGQMEDITEKSLEKVSQLNRDELQSEWKSLLSDMDVTTTDFAESLNNKLREAIANAIVSNEYGEKLAVIRQQIADMVANENYAEAERLRQEYDEMAQEAIDKVNAAYDTAGIGKNAPGQTHNKNVAASVSQETMDEVNGRLTNMQLNVTRMVDIARQSQTSLAAIQGYTASIPSIPAKLDEILAEQRTGNTQSRVSNETQQAERQQVMARETEQRTVVDIDLSPLVSSVERCADIVQMVADREDNSGQVVTSMERCADIMQRVADNTAQMGTLAGVISEGNGTLLRMEASLGALATIRDTLSVMAMRNNGNTGNGNADVVASLNMMHAINMQSQNHLQDIARYTSYLPNMYETLLHIQNNTSNI